MNLRQMKYEILMALLKLTGKRGVIIEYEAWVNALNRIADEEQKNPVARGILLRDISRITEEQMIKQDGFDVLKTYDPYQASKAQTQKKIEELKQACVFYQEMVAGRAR